MNVGTGDLRWRNISNTFVFDDTRIKTTVRRMISCCDTLQSLSLQRYSVGNGRRHTVTLPLQEWNIIRRKSPYAWVAGSEGISLTWRVEPSLVGIIQWSGHCVTRWTSRTFIRNYCIPWCRFIAAPFPFRGLVITASWTDSDVVLHLPMWLEDFWDTRQRLVLVDCSPFVDSLSFIWTDHS